jgi:hypothetical protein
MKKQVSGNGKKKTNTSLALLTEIRNELVRQRKERFQNTLILATAIVMFAVPLNFLVQVAVSYLNAYHMDENGLFTDWGYDIYMWLAFFALCIIVSSFLKFFRPISRIAIHSFDWKGAFDDAETASFGGQYYKDPDGEKIWYCEFCEDEFETKKEAVEHEETCEAGD